MVLELGLGFFYTYNNESKRLRDKDIRDESNEITMSDECDQTNGEFLSLSSSIMCWDRIISIDILQPFDSTYLHVLFSHAINLRILKLEYRAEWDRQDLLEDETLIDLIDDESLCNVLMSNGLRQLSP